MWTGRTSFVMACVCAMMFYFLSVAMYGKKDLLSAYPVVMHRGWTYPRGRSRRPRPLSSTNSPQTGLGGEARNAAQ